MSMGLVLVRRIHILDGGWQWELPSFEEEYGNARDTITVVDDIRIVGDFTIYRNYKRFAVLSDKFKSMATFRTPKVQAEIILHSVRRGLLTAFSSSPTN